MYPAVEDLSCVALSELILSEFKGMEWSESVHSQATSGLSLDKWHTMIHMIDPHLVDNFFNNFFIILS